LACRKRDEHESRIGLFLIRPLLIKTRWLISDAYKTKNTDKNGESNKTKTKQSLSRPFAVTAVLCTLTAIALVGLDCYQSSSSEACVWGKSLILLYIGFAVVFAAPIIFLIYYFCKKAWVSFKAG